MLASRVKFRDSRLPLVFLGPLQNVSHRRHAKIFFRSQYEGRSWLTILRPSRCVNHFQAIFNPNAPHNPVNVVLYGLFGKIKGGCDLFISQPLAYEGNNLLLPPCQPEIEPNARARSAYLLSRKNTKQVGA